MKKKICFLTALLTAFGMNATAKDYRYETVEGDPMQTRIYTLDNGLKIYLSVNQEKPRIQTYIAVRTGSRNDPAETTGLAHYLEHLMFKGTTHFGTTDYAAEKVYLDQIRNEYERYRTLTDNDERTSSYRTIDSLSQLAAKYFVPNEYDKMMAHIGAQGTNAFTSFDQTCYVEDIPANEIENWLKVESDRFQNMVIRGFHTELEAVYEEYNMYSAKDEDKFVNAFFAKLFPNHPYGTQTTIGRPEHLKNPSIKNIENYFRRYYVPNNVAICMAGDLDPEKTVALIDRYFGTWKPNPQLSRPEYAPLGYVAQQDTTVWGQEAERLYLAWNGLKGAADEQADTLEVLAQMLTNGKAGMLELNLEQPMKIQAVSAFPLTLHDGGALALMALPKDNQTLEELKQLLVDEMAKFCKGEFDDDLLPSVINNMKRKYYQQLLSNDYRAGLMSDAFVSDRPWSREAKKMERLAHVTKQEMVDFAQRYFTRQPFCVFKKQGTDTTDVKIAKPAIAPIQANRDLASEWMTRWMESQVEPIQPRFVDFKKDLTLSKIKSLPLVYKHNPADDLFTLSFCYPIGTENIKGLDLMPQYLYYIGTDKRSSADIKKAFYRLACDYRVFVSDDMLTVTLHGLNENLPEALALWEDFMRHAQGDAESYANFVEMVKKSREDNKTDQRFNYQCLARYAMYGSYNSRTNTLDNDELTAANPQTLPAMLQQLANQEHQLLYFGPYSEKQLAKVIGKYHPTPKHPAPAPEAHRYVMQPTKENEVLLAPYDAKNIYMMQFHCDNRPWNADEAPLKAVFNEYYGGSMNSVVFQELREARALAYSAFAIYTEPGRKDDSESFYTYIISQNDKMGDCIATFNSILDTMPQSKAAFDLAKESLKKQLESKRVTREALLNAYITAQQRGIDYDLSERIYQALPSITMDQMVDFERKFMASKPLRYVILGKESELDMKLLERIGKVKRVSGKEIYGF